MKCLKLIQIRINSMCGSKIFANPGPSCILPHSRDSFPLDFRQLVKHQNFNFTKNSITYRASLSSARPCIVLVRLRAARRQSPVARYRPPWFPFRAPQTKSIVIYRIWSTNLILVYKDVHISNQFCRPSSDVFELNWTCGFSTDGQNF